MTTAQPPAATSTWRWLALTIALCVLVTAASLWVGQPRNRIRNSDEAAYAEQARSLLDDGSLTIGFVRHFHVEYPETILHPEDFYPPGTGALIAASWAILGRSEFASAVPSILLTGLLLPLLAWALARRFGASPAFAFGCATAILFEPEFRFQAFQGLADVPFAAAVTAAVVLAMRSGRPTALFAGAALGLAFWFKPTAVLFAPGVAVVTMLLGARDRRELLWRVGLFGAGMLAVAAPWLVRNLILFDDPLYSGNKHLAIAASQPGFRYEFIRKVYWGDGAPALADAVTSDGLRAWLIRFFTHIYEIVGVNGAAAFGVPFVIGLLLVGRRRPVIAGLVVIVSFAVFLSAVFAVYLRYLMPLFPIVAAIAWAGGHRLAEALRDAELGWPLGRPQRIALILAALVSIPGGSQLARELAQGKKDFEDPGNVALWQAAEWAKTELSPAAVVMCQEALRFRHASGLRAVNVPWDTADAIDRVVRHYRVTHIVVTLSGDFVLLSNRHVVPYLEAHASEWTRARHGDFEVWTRNE